MKLVFNKILEDLYKNDKGLYPFTLYSRYKINPKEMFTFITKFTNKNIIKYDNDKITLTKDGKKKVFAVVFHNKTQRGIYSNLPEEFVGKKIHKNTPYIPKINYLSQEIHKKEG